MKKEINELDTNSFDSAVANGKWIIDFWADWCGPCKIMEPHFQAAAKEKKGGINFGRVNVDENYKLAQKFNIMSIPTTIIIKDGEIVTSTTGAMNKEQILKFIDEN